MAMIRRQRGSARARSVVQMRKKPSSSELIRAHGQDLPESSRPAGTLFTQAWSALVEGLFAVVFPSACRLCNAPLENISRLPVCEDCLARVIDSSTRGQSCFICGERL